MLFENENDILQNPEESPSDINEVQILKEKCSLLAADFENYKKRIEKEKKVWMSFAKIDSIKAFLPFLDEMTLAVSSLEEQANNEAVLTNAITGFSLILQNYQKKIFELGVVEMNYNTFNPEMHEAIGFMPSKDLSDESIHTVVKRGFLFDNQVLRYAQVIVVKNNN